jgi:hypothetical protein
VRHQPPVVIPRRVPYETLWATLRPCPSRLDAVLTAFALYAGEQESVVSTIMDAFGSASEAAAAIAPGWSP